jgi:hypothetical protein
MDRLRIIELKHSSGRSAIVAASTPDEARSALHKCDPSRYWPDADANVVSHNVSSAINDTTILLVGPTYRDM